MTCRKTIGDLPHPLPATKRSPKRQCSATRTRATTAPSPTTAVTSCQRLKKRNESIMTSCRQSMRQLLPWPQLSMRSCWRPTYRSPCSGLWRESPFFDEDKINRWIFVSFDLFLIKIDKFFVWYVTVKFLIFFYFLLFFSIFAEAVSFFMSPLS